MTMTGDLAAALTGGIALLERAINYTLGSLQVVTPQSLSRPTPCREWDLGALLAHLNDSVGALHEVIDVGHLGLDAGPAGGRAGPPAEPVAVLRSRLSQLLGAWTAGGRTGVTIAGSPVTAGLVSTTGALELTVHAWDVARACGSDRPIPHSLAAEMLDLAPLLVSDADRPGHFDPPVDAPPGAAPGDRLVAFLGRRP
jgi:uncharacterized protein (TIGR03086 family)